MTAITAITAQNTVGVDAIEAVSPELILAQVRAVARDIGVDAVKVGMLGSIETIDAVATALAELRDHDPQLPIVVDPVMVSETGAALLAPTARQALIDQMLPLATVADPEPAGSGRAHRWRRSSRPGRVHHSRPARAHHSRPRRAHH